MMKYVATHVKMNAAKSWATIQLAKINITVVTAIFIHLAKAFEAGIKDVAQAIA